MIVLLAKVLIFYLMFGLILGACLASMPQFDLMMDIAKKNMKQPPPFEMTRGVIVVIFTLFGGIVFIGTVIGYIKEVTKK